jgi:2-dehydropantoate 2-reductase
MTGMRFVIYGAGGIGAVLGGRLFESGHDVVLIARGAHHDAIRDNGLRVESPASTVTLKVPVVDHPSKLTFTDDDAVLMAMKSQDTDGALEDLAAAAPDDTRLAVVSLQNGVANEGAALRRFADVYGVCVMLPTVYLEPGVVQAWSAPNSGILDIGRYHTGSDARAEAIAAAFEASTFVSVARPDIMRWKYGKLLMNLGNALEAACGPSARASDLAGRARDEGVAALRMAGIPFVDTDEDNERRGDLLRMSRINGEKRGGGSTRQSLKRGSTSVETDYLNGEIVLLGRLHGVPTPVNELLQRVARRMAVNGEEPGSVDPDELVAALK